MFGYAVRPEFVTTPQKTEGLNLPVENEGHVFVIVGNFKHPTFCLVHAIITGAGIRNEASRLCYVCDAIGANCRIFKQGNINIVIAASVLY